MDFASLFLVTEADQFDPIGSKKPEDIERAVDKLAEELRKVRLL